MVPDVIIHMHKAHVGLHVVLNVQNGMDDVTGEPAAGAQLIELWVEEAMFVAEVASGLDAAFKAVDAVNGVSFIKYLLDDFIVGTEMEGRGLVG